MHYLISLVMLVVLASCTSYPTESRRAYAVRVCAESAIYPETRREFMRQCVATELGQPSPSATALYGAGAALQAYGAGFQGQVPLFMGAQSTPFGSPNSIGPYGTLGPTWQQFNTPFQQQNYGPVDRDLAPLVYPRR